MGRHTKGKITYHYKIKIDLSKIIDKITDEIGHIDDDYCWEIDGDDLIITTKHTTGYEYWHYNATLESPEENTLELADCVKDEVDAKSAVISALHSIDDINAEIIVNDEDLYV